jgi:outer membrane protein assembly factor BamE
MRRSMAFVSSPMRRFAIVLVGVLSGCSMSSITAVAPEPYRIDIQQGNVITQDMVAKLAPGMTKSQVRFVLGSPPITDMFHANRWDYVYRYSKAGKLTEERKLTLFFEGDHLTRVAGDVAALTPQDEAQAAEKPAAKGVGEIVLEKADPNAPPAPPPEEKGFFGRMLEKVGL